ncbi:MAG: guanylate kinase [Candidatus Aminicenantes bacterium]
MLFVITGPSGCGKSTLVKKVMEKVEGVEFSVSFTTRRKRDSEQEGRDYYFVSEQEFKQMRETDALAEWALVHGHYYGTSRREIEKKGADKDLLLDIDVQGAQQIKSKFKKAVFIFVLPPSFQELKKRLEKRGEEAPGAVEERLATARKEIRSYPQFGYIIVNDQIGKAVRELASIVTATRCVLDHRQKEIIPILRSFSEDE